MGVKLKTGKNIFSIAYPNLNRRSIGSTQPVAVGAEAQGCDDVIVIQCVQVLAIIEIPQHGLAVLKLFTS